MTRVETTAQGDANIRRLQKGDIIQLERKGYFIVDKVAFREGDPYEMLAIPDGKAKTWGVGSKAEKEGKK